MNIRSGSRAAITAVSSVQVPLPAALTVAALFYLAMTVRIGHAPWWLIAIDSWVFISIAIAIVVTTGRYRGRRIITVTED